MNVSQELDLLLDALCQLEQSGFAGGAALATLTRTRGPTFRRPGASMLVLGDGRLVCGLSGGCPQRDIVQRALRVIADGRAQLAQYNAEMGLDVLMEMGCDGELEVLIEPLCATTKPPWLDAITACRRHRRTTLLATVFKRDNECLQPGPQRLLWDQHVLFADIESQSVRAATTAAVTGFTERTEVITVHADDSEFDVLVEALLPQHVLMIMGTGASACALARLAVQTGWRVVLIDVDGDAVQTCTVPGCVRRIAATPETLYNHVSADAYTSAVVMTHNLAQDIAWLQALCNLPLGYLGALGSRQRAQRMRDATGLDGTQLHAPAGLDVGSETPQEIAIAVAAEVLAAINHRRGGPLHRHDDAIHG